MSATEYARRLEQAVSGPAVREWTGSDGETWYGMRPDLLAIRRQLLAEGFEPTPVRVREVVEYMAWSLCGSRAAAVDA
jgi:hypothetical protein